MAARPLDIAVAGAGPAGLAAALFLHRAGHRVTVFERFDTPRPLGSGLILQPTGMAVLARLGLADAVLGLGSRIDRLFGADAASGRTVLDVRYGALRDGGFGIGIHRGTLFDVLWRAVAEARIEVVAGFDAETLAGEARPTLVSVSGRRAGPFDLVVDASGARSRLRPFARHPAEPRELAYGAFWTTLAWRGPFDAHALEQRYRRASVMIGVLPIGSTEAGGEAMAALFWSLKPAMAEAVRTGGLARWKDEVVRHWPATEVLLDQIAGFDQLTLARYGHHTLRRPAGRGVAFVGDSAHSTSPQLGQGANMALLDAAALADALTLAPQVEQALEAYCRMRRRHVRLFQLASRAFTPFYQSDSTVLPFLRDTVVATVARVPPAPRLLARLVAGTIVPPVRTRRPG